MDISVDHVTMISFAKEMGNIQDNALVVIFANQPLQIPYFTT